ncbi:MAG TPA: hypothetical protein VMT00_09220 [Thermoanaerobaculia bacterium]|nr:hypothetical protein [Thermoanaerobaculia bacterium]
MSQLFDLPARLRYTFIASAEPGAAHGDQPIEIAELIAEAIQRHGAFAQARVLVPDRASLEPTGERPQPHPDEIDPILTREVWLAACSGAPPVEWQNALAHSWRARRLLAHWTESGALRLAPAGH